MKRKITVLLPKGQQWDDCIYSQSILPIASDQAVNLINQLSKAILKRLEFRAYPELMAMGFWMRKSHILKILDDHLSEAKKEVRLARGVVFHIAPSNVDSIFIYSWFLSMLMGNINVVRLSSKGGKQIDLILGLLNDLFKAPEHEDIARRQVLITYGYDDTLTSYLSANCDMRIIWGGDNTINKIRQIPIPPTAIELSFTDKFSMSLIGASEYIDLDEHAKSKLITMFINDAFWFGQMACSSPRLILWKGSKDVINEAKRSFWVRVYNSLDTDFADISAADIVNKLVASQSFAIESKIRIASSKNNLINRIQLYSLDDVNTDLHCGAALFYEFSVESLNEVIPIASRKIQTIGYFGVKEEVIRQFLIDHMPRGIDRFVPIGSALNFSPIWDGHNFLHEFTRIIDIKY